MNYEEHVREVATEMAKAFYTDFSERHTEQQERYVSHCHTHARIAVYREAESVGKLLSFPGNVLFSAKGNRGIYLFNNGLIPSLTCNKCYRELVIDPTGIYCGNGDCSEFWQDHNKTDLLIPKTQDNG